MRKGILVVLAVLVLATVVVTLALPDQQVLSIAVRVQANQHGAKRALFNEAAWPQWWPGTVDTTAAAGQYPFVYNDIRYGLKQKMYSGIVLRQKDPSMILTSNLVMIPLGLDSLQLLWNATLPPAGSNPVQKVQLYLEAQQLQRQMATILNRLQTYLQQPANLYGFTVKETMVEDTAFVAIKSTIDHYPTTPEVYQWIAQLQQYIATQGAQAMGQPMLNATAIDSTHYAAMVALPVNKELPPQGAIQPKRMIQGHILVAEIKGGPHTVQQAQQQMEYYLQDHLRVPPAIPYQSLVTNRLQQPDTAQWITRLYYPVM